ncbi:MAG: IclR family transcriptional regulator [Nocardioidaceae bacterium]|nr:IclR family transcriptional regulator [Nocardioidaceae bacterium]
MTGPTWPTIDPKNHVASVVKAISLLELFTSEQPELNLATLVERGGLTRTTTHRLLATLELVGWLERRGENYRLSLRVFRLGSTAVGAMELRHEASHVMSELAAKFGEDVYLVVPDGPRAVCLERIEGRSPVHVMALDVGKSLPLFIGGGGVALLAEKEAELLPLVLAEGEMITPTGARITLEQMQDKLAQTRARGYSISMEDVTVGVGALGSVVRDSRGTAVAAISLGGLLHKLAPPRQDELAAGVRAAADEISARLGHRPSRP